MPRRIVSARPITIPEVRELLSKLPANTLSPLQSRVLTYASTFSRLKAKDAEELVEELIEKHGLQRDEACQVANICPRTMEELRTVLSGYKRLVSTILFSDEKLHAILESVQKRLVEETQQQEQA